MDRHRRGWATACANIMCAWKLDSMEPVVGETREGVEVCALRNWSNDSNGLSVVGLNIIL